jgi:nucleotide-binding universal stress UspA family protein
LRPARATKIILVPLALSGDSRAALAVARQLAGESGAKLVLLHVVQLNIAGEERGIPRARLLQELCRDAGLQLQPLAASLGAPAAAEVLVCAGRPAEAIVETAGHLRADAIVMGTHGHRGWLKWLHRNTALNVRRRVPCIVWLVAPAREQAARPTRWRQAATGTHAGTRTPEVLGTIARNPAGCNDFPVL